MERETKFLTELQPWHGWTSNLEAPVDVLKGMKGRIV